MIRLRAKLYQHLSYNLYPSKPSGLIPYLERAIELASKGRGEEEVSINENGGTSFLVLDQKNVKAREVIEELRLEDFVSEDFRED